MLDALSKSASLVQVFKGPAIGALALILAAPVARAVVVDSFDAGAVSVATSTPAYRCYDGPGPLGGHRELYERDAHSNEGAVCDMTVDATAGTLELWGAGSANDQHVAYGNLIGSFSIFTWTDPCTGAPLGLSQQLADHLEIDVLQLPTNVSSVAIGVTLRTSQGDFATSVTASAPGTVLVPLTSFTGLTAEAAANINGIAVNASVGGVAQGSGLVLGEIRVVSGLVHADLIKQTVLATGDTHCPYGGTEIQEGLDDGSGGGIADDGILQPGEVRSTTYVCNGAPGADGTNGTNGTNGTSSIIKITQVPPGDNCPTGGVLVQTGLDTNGNGQLDASEVTSSAYVCNGQDGAAGANGANGTDGAAGPAGANGHSSLTTTTAIEAGDKTCPNGGVKVETGLDTNDNGKLDPSEVTSTVKICNGATGAAGTAGKQGPPGQGCDQVPAGSLAAILGLGLLFLRRRRFIG